MDAADHADVRRFLRQLFDAALQAADPLHALAAHLPPPPGAGGRTIVLGAGKASARMALALEAARPGPLEGMVVTRYGHGEACARIEVVEAAHPVPDAAGMAAAQRMLQLARSARAGDQVLCLVSGGGSSLLTLPADGVTLADKQALNRALLASGAAIGEINCVRRHLSQIKGGRLGLACGAAALHTLVLSDVPGDDPAVVASGPTLADGSTPADALQVLARHGIALPPAVERVLREPVAAPVGANGPRHCAVIATPQQALDAAERLAVQQGWQVLMLGSELQGESREAGRLLAGIAQHLARGAGTRRQPVVVLSGGETTVTLRHAQPGRGGRNLECLLAMGLAAGALPLAAIACDTDGIDGDGDAAGALWDPGTQARARHLGVDAAEHLLRHDAYRFFERVGGLVTTGPTRTNVNDFRAIALA